MMEPTPRPVRTVALFGLSADPPTGWGGHAGIVTWLARDLRLPRQHAGEKDPRYTAPPDQVWVLPVYRHPFPRKRELAPYEHRLAMARLAFEHLPGLEDRVRVRETERELAERQTASLREDPTADGIATITLVRHLMAEHPDTRFVLALGGDTYADLEQGKWRDSAALRRLLPIVVIPRQGFPVQSSEPHPPALSDVSSSAVRASTDLAFLRSALQPEVLEYVLAQGLYAIGRCLSRAPDRGPPPRR